MPAPDSPALGHMIIAPSTVEHIVLMQVHNCSGKPMNVTRADHVQAGMHAGAVNSVFSIMHISFCTCTAYIMRSSDLPKKVK